MKLQLLLPALLFSAQAFASQPHDRICIGSAKVAGQQSIDLILQWEITRTYDHGGPNEDSYEIVVQTRSCYGDTESGICTISTQAPATIAPGKKLIVPMKLVDKKGALFFKGKFDASNATLVGEINRGPGKRPSEETMAQTTVKLTCIAQPQLNLDDATDSDSK